MLLGACALVVWPIYVFRQHVYFRHLNDGSMVRQLPNATTLRFGFTVMLQAPAAASPAQGAGASASAPAHAPQRLFQRASQRLWEQAGVLELAKGKPQVMPFAAYARLCYPAAFNYSDAFVEFELPDGSMGGGLRTMQAGGVVYVKSLGNMLFPFVLGQHAFSICA